MAAVTYHEEDAIQFTKVAIDNGAKLVGIAEILLAAIVSRGLTAWLVGVKALEAGKEYSKETEAAEVVQSDSSKISNLDDAKAYLATENGKISNWAALMEEYNPSALMNDTKLRIDLLNDAHATRKQKEYAIIGINLILSYHTGLSVPIDAAIAAGATQ